MMSRNFSPDGVDDNAFTKGSGLEGSDGNVSREIAALAYQLWMERGRPEGSADEDWFRAEEQLREHHG